MEKKLSVIDEIYNKYEQFRHCKTKEEHADKFLAWFLTYKEQNKEKHKQEIIEAFRKGREAGAIFKSQKDSEGLAEQYFNNIFNQLPK